MCVKKGYSSVVYHITHSDEKCQIDIAKLYKELLKEKKSLFLSVPVLIYVLQ